MQSFWIWLPIGLFAVVWIFGSLILVNLIGQSLGILFGYWIGSANGEG